MLERFDTHILLQAVTGGLTPGARTRSPPGPALESSPRSCCGEIAKLAQLGAHRGGPGRPGGRPAPWPQVQVWPITAEIARESTRLDVRSDPADELIAATSVVHNVPAAVDA